MYASSAALTAGAISAATHESCDTRFSGAQGIGSGIRGLLDDASASDAPPGKSQEGHPNHGDSMGDEQHDTARQITVSADIGLNKKSKTQLAQLARTSR
ncbi:hypothetical protein C2845_PM09G10150 [Panicum miliaceum]|uniref:Uncharacterized protein n=1 Tax=Panicum miliaceum TaxID=4540 RepID=A0A3L6S0K7_PANMI|nr:hypothetical protein C2845_PM09G10150 [Panicum miliaceum]